MSSSNQKISPDQLRAIRMLSDFDLLMLVSEIHDHGWPVAAKTLALMLKAEQVRQTEQ